MKSLIDIVREHFPRATMDEIDGLLWSCTAYPFAGTDSKGREHYSNQLKELSEKANGNIDRAFAIADAETEAAMKEI